MLLALYWGLASAQPRAPNVRYEPSPEPVVQAMTDLAAVKDGDIVYDLGCGDGRIVIAAVKTRGVRGVCVDIDPERVAEARENAGIEGVRDRIRFVQGDLFQVPIQDATVVMLYLLPEVNLRLRPRLLAELRPRTRVVSHMFSMGDWMPEQHVAIGLRPYEHVLYRWVIPARKTARGGAP